MKRFYLSALFIFSALYASAQSSLDLISRAQLRQQRLEQKQQEAGSYSSKVNMLKSRMNVPASHTLGMIRLAPGATEDDLKAEGVNVLRCRYGFAFVSMPVSDVERVSSLKSVHRLQLARPVSKKMDKARAVTGVDKIHQGLGLPQTYTGKGVICGIVDGGIDPNHISFRDADGNSRIGWLAHLYVNSAGTDVAEKYYDRDEIYKFKTDDASTFHGTHTLNTMAGSYRGLSSIATAAGDGTATVAEQANPYYGVAYEADITATCAELLDMIIAMGVDYMLQYAEYEKKPIVINLSLGSNSGPHDGKGVINQFFDLCAKEANAIICIAAGNEGNMKIALNKTFAADNNVMQTFIAGDYHELNGQNVYARAGNVAIYSNDNKPFKSIQAIVYNKTRHRVAARFNLDIAGTSQGSGKYWVSSSDYQQDDSDIITTQFGSKFSGYVGLGWDIDADNDRFYVVVDYLAIDNMDNNADGNYVLGFIVEGEEGQRADAFCDGTFSTLSNFGEDGFDDGMTNGTISDMATGNSTLVVGSYNTREEWGELDGYTYHPETAIPAGEITSFSSYGTLVDGRNLPHVCAPGAAIISASSSYYVNAGNTVPEKMTAKTAESDRDNYWGWAMGTSMATPVVSGAIALWLEADPTLTMNDIKDIVAKTAVKDEAVMKADPVQAGAGKFDAYEGLKEVLRRSATGIGGVTYDKNRPLVSAAGDRLFKVFLGGAHGLNAAMYDLMGKKVMSRSFAGDEGMMDVSSLAKGVYILKVNDCHSLRIVVK